MKIDFPIPFLVSITAFLLISCVCIHGQETTNEVLDRDEYFRRLEQRALSLSKKFADISGTEPVRLITPRKAKTYTPQAPISYSPQNYYDALPGPQPDYEKPPVSIEQNNTAQSAQQFVDDQVIEFQPTMEDKRGEYFLRPFIAVQVPRDQKFNSVLSIKELDSYLGYSLGLHAGKRIENFTAGLRLSYFYNEMDKRDGTIRIDAENELLAISGTAGFSAPLTEKLSFDFGLGLGFGNRLNLSTLTIDTLSGSVSSSSSFEKTVFTYEFSLLLDYAYSENLSAFGGYRLVGTSDNGSFDRMVSHLFEVGVGANF